ncbi:MAG: SDR family oxidoreductase, partial [Bdellovibrionales bacterium]|nr:SDR family oxidoreductase [Bdellovibrionales bacterium]
GPEVERPLLFAGDITNVSHVTESLSSLIDNTGSIDVLFNNAGIFLPGTSEAKPDDFARMLAVNLTASFTFLHTVVPLMRTQKRGYIFHLSSYVGVEALPGTGAYAATKFGMMGLNQSLFRELVKEGINVTAIAPSWVNTAAAKDSPIAPEEMIQPSDIADTVEYLLRLRHGACVERVVIQCRSAVSNGPV